MYFSGVDNYVLDKNCLFCGVITMYWIILFIFLSVIIYQLYMLQKLLSKNQELLCRSILKTYYQANQDEIRQSIEDRDFYEFQKQYGEGIKFNLAPELKIQGGLGLYANGL